LDTQIHQETSGAEMTKRYLVVVEANKNSYGAMSPDIPGCFALGSSLEEVKSRFVEAAEAHMEWLARSNDPIPEPSSTSFDLGPEEEQEIGSFFVLERLPIHVPSFYDHAVSA
jgi:predicted RNase H-like HicB family nuclease